MEFLGTFVRTSVAAQVCNRTYGALLCTATEPSSSMVSVGGEGRSCRPQEWEANLR